MLQFSAIDSVFICICKCWVVFPNVARYLGFAWLIYCILKYIKYIRVECDVLVRAAEVAVVMMMDTKGPGGSVGGNCSLYRSLFLYLKAC